jgi:ribosomal subunit interface protein
MTLRVSGKNMDIGEALRGQVEVRVGQALAKFYDGAFKGHVTVEREGSGFRTDCVLHLSSGITLEATGAAHDAYAAFDQTAERLEKRLRRYNRRLKDRTNGYVRTAAPVSASYSVLETPSDDVVEDGEFHPVVIAETTKDLHRHSVSEAVLELDLSGAHFLVFQHAGSGRVNIVYRRRDGAIGWIDPPAVLPS